MTPKTQPLEIGKLYVTVSESSSPMGRWKAIRRMAKPGNKEYGGTSGWTWGILSEQYLQPPGKIVVMVVDLIRISMFVGPTSAIEEEKHDFAIVLMNETLVPVLTQDLRPLGKKDVPSS